MDALGQLRSTKVGDFRESQKSKGTDRRVSSCEELPKEELKGCRTSDALDLLLLKASIRVD